MKDKPDDLPEIPRSSLEVDREAIPSLVRDFVGSVYLDLVALLGQRTAQLHRALASLSRTPEVTPEPFSLLYQKSLYQSIHGLILKVFDELNHSGPVSTASTETDLREILAARKTIFSRLQRITKKRIDTLKIRTHGDYHLGQVLFTGKDFVIIDFEGEPVRPMTERHLKHSALRDVAGMIRSFHYAAHSSLLVGGNASPTDLPYLQHWAALWYVYVSGTFLHAYIETAATERFLPQNKKDLAVLLETFLMEKVVYELGYELHNRPDWLSIPLRGIDQILKGRY